MISTARPLLFAVPSYWVFAAVAKTFPPIAREVSPQIGVVGMGGFCRPGRHDTGRLPDLNSLALTYSHTPLSGTGTYASELGPLYPSKIC